MKMVERQYTVLGLVLLFAMVIVTCAVWAHYHQLNFRVPLVLLLFFSGFLGGASNHFRRLQALRFTDEELKKSISSYSLTVQSIISPCIGGVFAVMAYLIFGAGLLRGPLFPAFQNYKLLNVAESTSLSAFFLLQPKLNRDIALMFIWAFLAGFSEKFIPNFLDRLTQDVDINSPHPKPNPPILPSEAPEIKSDDTQND